MYKETLDSIAATAVKKVNYLKFNKLKYLVLAIFAGAFVGFGIMLVFSITAPIAAAGLPYVKLIMGASFSVALLLVLFAGSELFTGNNLIMTIGWLDKKISLVQMLELWFYCYFGNLIGSISIAWLIFKTGLISNGPTADLIISISSAKMNGAAGELFFKGILCNILVCLAVWMASKVKNEMAKITLIFWCLFAFVGSGFEHSIANMSLLTMSLMIPHPAQISIFGFIHNLTFVTMGNIVGGSFIIGALYWYAASGDLGLKKSKKKAA